MDSPKGDKVYPNKNGDGALLFKGHMKIMSSSCCVVARKKIFNLVLEL